MMTKPILKISEDKQSLCVAVAEFFIELVQSTVKDQDYFAVSISGGSSPKPLYELLTTPAYKKRIPWEKLYIFWGDERYISVDSEENNAHVAYQIWLQHVPIPKNQIFPIPILESPEKSALAYEKTLQDFFHNRKPQFDLILLGLGANAHTASLFPHTEVLNETKHWVKSVFVPELNMNRITMTPVIINQASQIAFLVEGSSKAKAVHEILYGTKNPEEFPAQLIQPLNGKLTWFLDKSAYGK